jgi:3'-phosphoadenosine 5'-phosphosulfate sulfotransferase (PAPS reductase)/FAD synthetase
MSLVETTETNSNLVSEETEEAKTINHIVFFSSGKASWMAAKKVAEKFGTEHLWLVFADTRIEDPDNYRFLEDVAKNVGGKLIKLKDGRTPWDVFRQKKRGCVQTKKVCEPPSIKLFY